MGNGSLGASELAPATGGVQGSDPGCGQLANDTARRWNAMAVHIHEKTGIWIGCNGPDSMYRSYARQVYWKAYWSARGAPGNAATPGTSNHGWGRAIDNSFRLLIDNYGGPFGFRWACSDAPWESWHLKDCGPAGAYSGPDPGPYGSNGGGGKPNLYPNLEKGDKGDAVKRLQERLRIHNHGLTRPNTDGSFGEGTADAVREFQITHNLDVDGRVGNQTWGKLRKRNPLTENESSHVNRLRLLERGDNITDDERSQIHRHREWIAKRRDWMKKHGEQWWTNQRHVRYRILKREAGDA